MSRIIKFRAWDKKNKWMCHVGELYLPRDDFENGAVINVYPLKDEDTKDLDDPWYEIIQPNFVLIQNTGLKDKNGKEIYEGDLISNGLSSGIVKYEKNAFIYWGLTKKDRKVKDYEFMYFVPTVSFEVIGNIYENKELIK